MPTYNTGALDLDEGDQPDFQADSAGNLKVVLGAAGTLPTGAATAAKQDSEIALLTLMRSAALIPAGSPTYAAAGSGYAGYATPADLITISGSATKTVVVTNLAIFIQSS